MDVSVNLLSYSVYLQLGLGELKPTPITLQLADRSVKIPRGVVEDVLVKVDKILFPMDFIILDTEPVVTMNSHILVIIGRSFLVTSNAVVHYRSGELELSFGNFKVTLNIFNVGNHPPEFDDIGHVDMIESLVLDSFEHLLSCVRFI